MIKRSMRVAVAEENYVRAAQLRDHPVMVTYRHISLLRQSGRLVEAIKLQDELDAQAAEWRFADIEGGGEVGPGAASG